MSEVSQNILLCHYVVIESVPVMDQLLHFGRSISGGQMKVEVFFGQ